MNYLRRSQISLLLELLVDSGLLLLWIAQAFVVACLLIYGHIPLPRNWLNNQLAEHSAGGITLQAESFKLNLNGSFEADGLEAFSKGIEKPIVEAGSALIRYSLFTGGETLKLDEIVIADGNMFIPAVYAPTGQRTVLLEQIAVDIELKNHELHVRSLCAKHEDVSLRGAITIPFGAFGSDSEGDHTTEDAGESAKDRIGAFYEKAAEALAKRAEYHALTEPTLAFTINATSLHDVQVEALLSSPKAKYQGTELQNASVQLSTHLIDGKLAFSAPTIFQTEQLSSPAYSIRANNLSCQITKDDWDELLALQWPTLELSAQRLYAYDVPVNAPFFKLWRDAPNVVGFEGSAKGLKGAVNFEGAFDVLDRDAWVDIDGSINAYTVLPQRMKESLPELSFNEPPHYNVELNFAAGLKLDRAYFDVSIPSVAVDKIEFDQILARGKYEEGIAEISDLLVIRENQEVYANMRHNHHTGAFDVLARGTLNPQDYSPLLPRWWDSIFSDFTITDNSFVNADFIIQSNLKTGSTRYFYGSVDLEEIDYSKVPITEGRVIVRGTPRYIEIHILEADGSEGSLEGAIAFAVLPDDKPSPVSLHLDVDLALSREATENLLGEVSYQRIVGDFEFTETPAVTVEGVSYYDQHYPEFAGKSYYRFTADSRGPITYNGTPLDYLTIVGYSDDTLTQGREVTFGYAKGQGIGEFDIIENPGESNTICLSVEIEDANEELAIANLPALDEFEDDLKNSEDPVDGDGRLTAKVHAIGPVDDPFAMEGFGTFTIRDREIGTIRMLGPLSRVVGFTAFELDTLTGAFALRERKAYFADLRVDGPRTQIQANGTMGLEDQSLDMRVTVRLFGNATSDGNPINRITRIINPLAMLLRFRVTGTVENQQIRSTYDPRNLLPGSKK